MSTFKTITSVDDAIKLCVMYAPSKDSERCPSAQYQYAILLEE